MVNKHQAAVKSVFMSFNSTILQVLQSNDCSALELSFSAGAEIAHSDDTFEKLLLLKVDHAFL